MPYLFDTDVLSALLRPRPDLALARRLAAVPAQEQFTSAVTLGELLAELVAAADAVVIEFGPRHWREAVSAWWRFGKGRHPAGLNFGDCLAYAAAVVAGEPLLATGDDFPQTDVRLA